MDDDDSLELKLLVCNWIVVYLEIFAFAFLEICPEFMFASGNEQVASDI